MKVVTWNLNSIRQRLPRLLALLERHRPDAVCLQETKVTDELFPHDEIAAAGYRAVVHGQPTYNGVAIVNREEAEDVAPGFPGNPVPDETRAIAATVGGVRLLNLYVINGRKVGSDKYARKLAWLDALVAWVADAHDPDQPLLAVGDYNIAPEDRDVHDPERWRGKIMCSDAERERLRGLLDWGLIDLQRRLTGEGGLYTWWDYRAGAFHRGWGLRIDLALGTAPVAERVEAVEIERDERKKTFGEGNPSDHAPVIVTLRA